MADTMHDGRLAEAFGRFRSEAREEIQPPGTQAVRQAAHRRRTIRLACAAAVVALAGAGAGVVAAVTVDRRGATPGEYPPLSEAEWKERATRALWEIAPDGYAFGFPIAVTAQTQDETYSIDHSGSSPLRFVQGQDYDIAAVCLGRGTVRMAWEAPGGVTGSARVVCGGDTVRVRFVPRADGPAVVVRLTPDAEAIGQAGIAVAAVEFE
jgi:hypothetical protein